MGDDVRVECRGLSEPWQAVPLNWEGAGELRYQKKIELTNGLNGIGAFACRLSVDCLNVNLPPVSGSQLREIVGFEVMAEASRKHQNCICGRSN
jgi:hypothetical protein